MRNVWAVRKLLSQVTQRSATRLDMIVILFQHIALSWNGEKSCESETNDMFCEDWKRHQKTTIKPTPTPKTKTTPKTSKKALRSIHGSFSRCRCNMWSWFWLTTNKSRIGSLPESTNEWLDGRKPTCLKICLLEKWTNVLWKRTVSQGTCRLPSIHHFSGDLLVFWGCIWPLLKIRYKWLSRQPC